MSALEQVIFEKIRQLEAQQQQQVLEFVESLQSGEASTFDFEAWQAKVDEIHQEILAEYGQDYSIDFQTLLDEVRDESSEWA
jgi:hypothetical protein